MKIIDILNKKANGTLEDGFKFKYDNTIYRYNKTKDNILDKCERYELGYDYILENLLNETVEVIEENKEIEELSEDRYIVTDVLKKINELVRAVNKLTKEREEK